MKRNITEEREALIASLESLTEDQKAEAVNSMDGPYNPHVYRLTVDHGLREQDGRIRTIDAEIAYQKSRIVKESGK